MRGHVLHLIGEHVRRGHLDRGRQVDDHRVLGGRLDDADDRIAHLDRVFRLSTGERFGAVLVIQVDALGLVFKVLAQLGRVGGELLDLFLVLAEHDLALQHGDRVVEVHNRTLGALERLVSAANQVLTTLGEHDDGHVVGDELAFNKHADEVEIRLRGGREAHFDFLESHGDEQVPEAQLALGVHRVDERLVAVAKVDGAPARGTLQTLARPRALGIVERHLLVVGDVLGVRHIARLLRLADESCGRQQRVVVPPIGRRGDRRKIKH